MEHLVRKLSHFAPLSERDERKLRDIGATSETFAPHVDFVRTGERPRSVFVVKRGFACRYRVEPSGERQIMTFLIPGDICDLHVFLLKEMDHSIAALEETELAAIPREEIINLFYDYPRISAAFWWSMLQEEAILRERIVALGRRTARGRIGYLLCELFWRLRAVEETDGKTFDFPLTQAEIADCLGLSTVHVNRTLQELRKEGVITTGRGTLRIDDIARLSDISGFDERYLHLAGAPDDIRAIFDRMEGAPAARQSRRA